MRGAILGAMLLGLVGCDQLSGRGEMPAAEAATADPQIVAVDWLGRGVLFAGQVTGRRGDFTRIEYADGDHEWVAGDRIRPWPNLSGQRVQFYTGTRAIDVTVQETRDGLLHVAFDDGADTWISPDMLYRLEAGPQQGGAGGGGGGGAASFPPRAPADPASIRAGAHVLAYWISNGEIQRTRPWRATVASRTGETVHLSYEDGSEADLPLNAVLRVFDGPSQPAMGSRYWLAGDHPVGTLLEQRAGLTKVNVGGSEQWLEQVSILAAAPTVEPGRLEAGVMVTALWSGNSLYHGTVVSMAGDQVTLAWHDGSDPSAVPASDVLEVWQAAQ